SAVIGQWIFLLLSIFQLILVSFIAPAFTAGQISLEREKQTLDLLISTPMRPSGIVVGKLLAALAYVVLLIVAAVPISAIVLMYGGAGVDDIVRQQVVLLATALGLGSIGLFYSALIKRTQAATVLTYITVLGMTIGTVMIFIFWSVLLIQDDPTPDVGVQRRAPEQLMYVNPGVAMLDVVSYTESGAAFGGITGVSSSLGLLRGQNPANTDTVVAPNGVVCQGDVCFGADDLGRPAPDIAIANPVVTSESGYWWPRFSLTFLAMSVLLTLASMRLMVPAGMPLRFGRRRRAALAPQAAPVVDELPKPES
ncbi:MAG: ABC transporter permease, partial [Candidatus Limnocylindria bacterium]